jgi:hypothetical protein
MQIEQGMKHIRWPKRIAGWFCRWALGIAALIVLIPSQSQQARAADTEKKTPVLVELFTSEGCSSCPPADDLLQAIDRQQPVSGADVIVLSEHVDYWNYDGWQDPFSSSTVTERQKDYSARFDRQGPYTPEAVVDGAKGMNGSDQRALLGAIEEAAQKPKLDIAITNAAISGKSVDAQVKVPAHSHADLYAVLADDHDQSSVSRGENSGRHLEHVAVLRSIQKVGSLDKDFEKQIRLNLPHGSDGKVRLVLFVQERSTGHILGVAETRL